MRKSLQPTDADIAERNEHARKVFRYISEVARRLDEANGACKTVSDLFKTSVEINRQKLRDNCEKLMFADPVLYGYKAQEILWRKGYYEVVTMAKQLDNKDQPSNLLLAHIEAGIGHYQQIIYKMQMEHNINVRGLVDYPILDIEAKIIDSVRNTSEDDLNAKSIKSIQNCLIYIGDLCRYKADLESEWDPTFAARYYLQAACINRDIGTPYNQLGSLYIGKNLNLDSVCYYLHCLTCHVPFEGVEDNLVGLLDKNNKTLENMLPDYSETSPSSEKVKLFICRFLSLFDNWYFQKESQDLNELSNITLIAFKDCLQLEPDLTTDNGDTDYLIRKKKYLLNEVNPQYISSNIVLNVTSICLLCTSKLRDSDDKSLFPIKAFTLAFFSQLLEKLLRYLQDIGFVVPVIKRSNGFIKQKFRVSEQPKKSSIKENPHKTLDDESLKCENHDVSNGAAVNVDSHRDKTQRRSAKLRLRRRKHRKSDSNMESAEESCSDLSELELNESGDEISLEGETSSDEYCSELEDHVKNSDTVKKRNSTQAISKNVNEVTRTELHETEKVNDICDDKDVKNVVVDNTKLCLFFSDNILPSMVLLQAFLENEVNLIKSCGKSGHVLFKTLVDVLNILNANFLGKHSLLIQRQTHQLLDELQQAAEGIQKYYKMIPLPEDIKFKDVPALKQYQSSLKWEMLNYFKASSLQENAIRIMRLVDFGHFVTTLIPGVCYNKPQQYFFVKYKFLPKKPNPKNSTKKFQERRDFKRHSQKQPIKVGVHPVHNRIHHSSVHSKNNSDTSQMRILGKLWLMNQVRELETQVQSGKKSHNFPPYVVIDTEALCLHIKIIKQLVGARKFIVLVPSVVLQAIDELKKESSGARDAIRWLEAQLRSGSRFLRAQRPQEVAPVTWVKYPKKMNRDMQNFVQIIEFCNYFITKDKSATKNTGSWSGNGDSESVTGAVDNLVVKGKIDDKIKEENGDTQPTNIIVLLTGSKQYLNIKDQNKDFSFTGLAQTAGISMEFIQDFSLKWRHVLYKNMKRR